MKFKDKIIFFDAAIGSKSYTIFTIHVKNIFPTDSISLYTMSNNGFYSKLYFTVKRLEHFCYSSFKKRSSHYKILVIRLELLVERSNRKDFLSKECIAFESLEKNHFFMKS